MEFERKTIFLYPETSEQDKMIFKTTSQLITRISKIANISNKIIKDILYGGCFSDIKCKPVVSMRCIGQSVSSDLESSNVRICIAKYDDIDYTSNYKQVIDDFKNGTSNISHLVALHICSQPDKNNFKFSIDSNQQFDAIVTTDLEHLNFLLVAIMLDISLYHYFSLSNEIDTRKTFNKVKFHYILNHIPNSEIQKIYGTQLDAKSPIYLPFSMKRIVELLNQKKDKWSQTIKTLINEYFDFIIEATSIKVKLTDEFYIENSSEIKSNKYYNSLENSINHYRKNNQFTLCKKYLIVLTDDNMTKKSIPSIIEYKSESFEPNNLLDIFNDDINEYEIFMIGGEQ